MSSIPIIFIHFGPARFLKWAIDQAHYSNPKSSIFLIGDLSNQNISKKANHILISSYEERTKRLKQVYKHHSSNSFEYEYFCIKRWFLLYEFMEEHNLDWVFALDSDVMLYGAIQPFFEKNIYSKNYEAALCIPEQKHESYMWSASAGTAFVSKRFLKGYCDFVIDTYENKPYLLQPKISYHLSNNVYGGVCDMNFFYLYSLERIDQVYNLLVPNSEKEVFDGGISSSMNFKPNEFPLINGLKNVKFKKKKPICTNTAGEEINFMVLHFHGSTKGSMLKFYRGPINSDILNLWWLPYKSFIRHISGGVRKRLVKGFLMVKRNIVRNK